MHLFLIRLLVRALRPTDSARLTWASLAANPVHVFEQQLFWLTRTAPSSSSDGPPSMRFTPLLISLLTFAQTAVALTEYQYLQAAKDFADSFLSPRNAEIAASINS